MKILCVEDEPESLAQLTCMLEGIGYEVMPAHDAGQALDLIRQQPIDGVLLEYNLPDTLGSTLRARLKVIKPEIPVLLSNGVTGQTPFMVRFLDAYLRNRAVSDNGWEGADV